MNNSSQKFTQCKEKNLKQLKELKKIPQKVWIKVII